MKKLLPLASLVVIIAITPACSRKSETGSCCKTTESGNSAKTVISDQSIFLLESSWETYNNSSMVLSDLGGKVTVAAMIFTHCPSACPRIVADMKNIESALVKKERKQVQFLLISMDPERDTPERMRQFAADHRLKDTWEMIRADKAATMEIAQVLGVRIKPLDDGGFDHSNIIHILNRDGELSFQQQGLNIDPGECLKQIRQLL
ncbi:SCO family protein [Lentimicrobium saccharophilum]|nr:SCO family protein [Lentimicrobium saccharophilum]